MTTLFSPCTVREVTFKNFAGKIRQAANLTTMAVGFLWDAIICEALLASGQADMIAIARELLNDPNWPLHAAAELGTGENHSLMTH